MIIFKIFLQLSLLGKLRLLAVEHLEEKGVIVRDLDSFNFTWVVDFPLFEFDTEKGKISSVHHPFTRPINEDLDLIYTNPLKVS